jgi:hypothetical protein
MAGTIDAIIGISHYVDILFSYDAIRYRASKHVEQHITRCRDIGKQVSEGLQITQDPQGGLVILTAHDINVLSIASSTSTTNVI